MAPPSRRVNALELADYYLKYLGWPSTPTTRRVLAAWFMAESPRVKGSSTDIILKGNNPLNITCRSCSSYWLSGGGSHKVVIYDSQQAGAEAFKQLINGGGPGYSGIVSAFKTQPDNAGALISSINRSGWVTGGTNSYITHGRNFLAAVYNSLGSNDIDPNKIYNQPSTTPTVKAFGDLISFPEGHVITEDDIHNMSETLDKNHFFDNYVQKVAFEEFMKQNALGKAWNKQLEDTLAKQANADATNVGNATNVGPLTVNLFGALTGKAAAIAAILVGVGLVVAGGWLIMKDIYNQNGSGMVDPTPIFVRE